MAVVLSTQSLAFTTKEKEQMYMVTVLNASNPLKLRAEGGYEIAQADIKPRIFAQEIMIHPNRNVSPPRIQTEIVVRMKEGADDGRILHIELGSPRALALLLENKSIGFSLEGVSTFFSQTLVKIKGFFSKTNEVKPDNAKNVLPKVEVPKIIPPKVEAPKNDPPKVEIPKNDPPKVEIPKNDPPKVEVPKNDPPKVEVPKNDPPKVEIPKNDPPKVEVPKNDPPKVEVPKNDPPKVEIPKNDPPKDKPVTASEPLLTAKKGKPEEKKKDAIPVAVESDTWLEKIKKIPVQVLLLGIFILLGGYVVYTFSTTKQKSGMASADGVKVVNVANVACKPSLYQKIKEKTTMIRYGCLSPDCDTAFVRGILVKAAGSQSFKYVNIHTATSPRGCGDWIDGVFRQNQMDILFSSEKCQNTSLDQSHAYCGNPSNQNCVFLVPCGNTEGLLKVINKEIRRRKAAEMPQ